MAKGKKRSKGKAAGSPRRGPQSPAGPQPGPEGSTGPGAPPASTSSGPPSDGRWLWAAAVLAGANLALGIFQWIELVASQSGETPFCALNSKVNCTAVWNSPFAKAIHAGTGVPLAGWGIVWSWAALVTAVGAAWMQSRSRRAAGLKWAARLTALAGAVSCVVFLVASVTIGAVCLTCLATYALVWAYGGTTLAFRTQLGFSKAPLGSLFGAPLAAVAVGYGLVLGPGLKTPVSSRDAAEQQAQRALEAAREGRSERSDSAQGTPKVEAPESLSSFLQNLPGPAREAVAAGLASLRGTEPAELRAPRHLTGSPDAPVQMLDFVDVMCGHCAHLDEVLGLLRSTFSEDDFSVETRFFPLDRACNPEVQRGSVDPDRSPRCVGPKAIICAESDPGYTDFKHAVFENFQSLTVSRIESLAERYLKVDPASMMECIQSKKTERALLDDVEYAMEFNLRGTPLLLVNGREVRPSLPLLMALILAEGDTQHPAFEALR